MALQDKLVNGSLESFVRDARAIAHLRRVGDFIEFRQVLLSLGMNEQEVEMFWERMDLLYDQSTSRPETNANTQLSLQCGIMLDSRFLPRNLLLYRLVQAKFPGMLSVHIRTVRDQQDTLPGRWEFVDGESRRVLDLQML